LTPEEVEALRGRSNWMGLWLVVHAWAVVFAAMALVVGWPARWAFILGLMVISNRQLDFAILMHDAAHRLLFADPGAHGREAVAGDPSSDCEAIETVERGGLITLG
jgi:fatty acid desaturase